MSYSSTHGLQKPAEAISECQASAKEDANVRLRDVARRLIKSRSDYCRALEALDRTWAVSPAAVNDIIDTDFPGREHLSDDHADSFAAALEAEVRTADCVW